MPVGKAPPSIWKVVSLGVMRLWLKQGWLMGRCGNREVYCAVDRDVTPRAGHDVIATGCVGSISAERSCRRVAAAVSDFLTAAIVCGLFQTRSKVREQLCSFVTCGAGPEKAYLLTSVGYTLRCRVLGPVFWTSRVRFSRPFSFAFIYPVVTLTSGPITLSLVMCSVYAEKSAPTQPWASGSIVVSD
jgi:hypothetical protein